MIKSHIEFLLNYRKCLTFKAFLDICQKILDTYRSGHKTLAIKLQGESREIAGKHRKFHSKNNGDHFFQKLRWIALQRTIQKTMGITLEILALFDNHHFLGRMTFFSFKFKVWGGGGGSWPGSHKASIKFPMKYL